MNPMFNEYKDAGKIQEALLIGRNMVNKAPGDSECVNAYLDFLLMLAEKLPRTDERKSFADQANLVLSFYEENAQCQEIKETGKVRGAEGHHQKNVADHPEDQGDPDNIKFYKSRKEHLEKGHNGDFHNSSDLLLSEPGKASSTPGERWMCQCRLPARYGQSGIRP